MKKHKNSLQLNLFQEQAQDSEQLQENETVQEIEPLEQPIKEPKISFDLLMQKLEKWSMEIEQQNKELSDMVNLLQSGWTDEQKMMVNDPKQYQKLYSQKSEKPKEEIMAKQFNEKALQALKECKVKGNLVYLPSEQLDRAVYLDVKSALELIGGKWKGGKTSAFVFDGQTEEQLTELLEQVADGENRNLKKEFQFFATPDALADCLVELAVLSDDDIILEPSAGQGAIIKAINKVCASVPDCYELMDVNLAILKKSGLSFNLIGTDFLYGEKKGYSKIIANPPFSKNQDIDHLKKMFDCLADGGRLVCITSESWVNGSQKKQVDFREWLESVGADVLDIEKGAFKESGTNVGGKIVIIDKKFVNSH